MTEPVEPIPPALPPPPVVATAPLAYATPSATYHASGNASAMGVLMALGGGLLLAAIVGVLMTALLLARLHIPDVILFLVPGGVIGLGVAWLIRRGKVRNRAMAGVIAGVCAFATIAALVGSLYVVAVYKFRDQMREYVRDMIVKSGGVPEAPENLQVIEQAVAEPFAMYDQLVLVPRQRRPGPLGFAQGLPSDAKGLLGAVAIGSILMAFFTTRQVVASRPFCEQCGTWYNEPFNGAVLPYELADAVALAVQQDDTAQIREIRKAYRDAKLEFACTVVRLYRCPKCSMILADVVTIGSGTPGVLLPPVRIGPEMREALKLPEAEVAQPDEQVETAEGEETETAAIDRLS